MSYPAINCNRRPIPTSWSYFFSFSINFFLWVLTKYRTECISICFFNLLSTPLVNHWILPCQIIIEVGILWISNTAVGLFCRSGELCETGVHTIWCQGRLVGGEQSSNRGLVQWRAPDLHRSWELCAVECVCPQCRWPRGGPTAAGFQIALLGGSWTNM